MVDLVIYGVFFPSFAMEGKRLALLCYNSADSAICFAHLKLAAPRYLTIGM